MTNYSFDTGEELPHLCLGCGADMLHTRSNRFYCTRDCQQKASKHTKRNKERAEALPQFVAVDGEGVTDKNGHRYVLLSCGANSFHKNGKHLKFTEVLEFLYSNFDPAYTYVGYYLGYDFTQWMRTLPMERGAMLLNPARRMRNIGVNPTPFPVRWNGWEFDFLSGRRWKLRPDNTTEMFTAGAASKPWMYICDVGGYFQMPFVRASDPKDWHDKSGPLMIATPEEIEIIERGKAKRAVAKFDTPKQRREMIAYNQAENAVLERMMSIMAGGMQSIGVKLNKTQWFGPGQVAQAWMKQHNTHTREAVQNAVPPEALQYAQDSFFGGWFETMRHGHVPGTTWEYDINSAYPNIHSKLPCLLHGTWTYGEGTDIPAGLVVFKGTIWGTDKNIGAAIHRTPKGRVLRPHNTRGTFWLHEVAASIDAGLVDAIDVDTWWHYEPCACAPPMHELAGLFDKRIEVGKKTPAGKSYKLTYNSAYGKTAQSVGNPLFANPIHASLITAGTRTMICEAIASHPLKSDAVVKIATDGLYLSSEHPTLDIGSALGQWEGSTKQNLTIVMPGVYWDDEVRDKRVVEKIKSRGVNAAALLAMIDEFDTKFSNFKMWQDEWPKVDTYMGFAMITAKQALARNNWDLCGHVLTSYKKTLNSDPHGKRAQARTPGKQSQPWALREENIDSAAYRGTFGLELQENKDLHISDDGMTMDQSLAQGIQF